MSTENELTEFFENVAYNLDAIYRELRKTDYCFKTAAVYNFERPLHRPLPDTEDLLKQLDDMVKPYGYVPLSLKMFYRIVGGCNFCWDYETEENIRWRYADPIQITSLDDTLRSLMNDNSFEEMYTDMGYVSIPLSADYYHKDNISGGEQYAIRITETPVFDSEFLNEKHNTTFMNYLRIAIDNCGFPQMQNPENSGEYLSFFQRVKPQLKQI
ncbi:MAG: hypothetical protein K0S33_2525 [Bacteroidetes bacterium]|jgi:hypothetical protein|nr:hypothetical protein [Bacteroidota bacterium]